MDPPAPPYPLPQFYQPPISTVSAAPPYPLPQFYQPPISTVSAAPAITFAAAEALNNNITHVAADPNPPPSNPVSNHPAYAEMIYAAITALKEKDGSSKRAIAKYIERVYSGLPSTFSALLTHNLKRLKNNGQLVMVKKSYALPRSDISLPPPTAPAAPTTATATTALPSASSQSRGRGRPPKPKPGLDPPGFPLPISHQPIPNPQQPMPTPQPIIPQQPNLQQPISIPILQQPILQQPFSIPIPQQPNWQQQQPNFQAFPEPEPNAQPVFVALGLADEPASAQRRPGRPRKIPGAVVSAAGQGGGGPVSGKRGRGRPPGTRLSKKMPGRSPKKPKSISAVVGPNGLVKRGRGRPPLKAEPKSVVFPQATNVPIMGAFEQNNVPNVNVVAAQQQPPPPRRRGRPKRDGTATAAVGVNAGGIVSGKRRGRPPRVPGVEQPKTKRSTGSGRPVGRPKKNASLAITEVPDPQSVPTGEFKKKLEFFQFRLGQAVGALKPYLNPEGAVNAVAAIQELEGIASMDINAPLNIEPQQTPLLQS